ncbi:GNAT family N-acetyltransferase [Pelagibacterium sp. 26DY04]|uniref:GNAT family N-acetyltransferase n=1 Tax=Pelagibacterium sp. 26DY04 TaxID=2967130 RepID=UPI0028156515|nr:GNAT family N-acetyltransferase [Pelagibacterium sp. 26DY04]WMT87273.1 GNAT family N-acetyltransferase [Pelagibacterium sp. 26DY04]
MHAWRPLLASDLPTVSAIAEKVHPDFPEDDAVFADRQAIAPATCFLFEDDDTPAGYLLAHPWRLGQVPALNTVLGEIPAQPDTLYIHDLALLPAARGTGAGAAIVERLAGAARPLGAMSLVAVNRSTPFWTRMGFFRYDDEALVAKLASYDSDAQYMVRTSVLANSV